MRSIEQDVISCCAYAPLRSRLIERYRAATVREWFRQGASNDGIVFTLLPAALACLFLCSCSKPKEKEAEPVLPVQVTAVVSEPIQRVITAEGILRAMDQSGVMPKISAPVSKFYVNRGDHVKKGQLLATLENKDLAAAVTDTKGSYDQAAAAYRTVSSATVPNELVKAQADAYASKQQVDAAKKLLDSREQLYREGALARKLVDEAAVQYAQAKSASDTAEKTLQSLQSVGRHEEVKGAAGALDSAKGKLEAAQAQLSYTEVRSPISGVVADRPSFAGEMANAGAALITIVDISSVIARVNIPQSQAAFVRVGQPAHVASTDGAVESNGRVTVVSPAVDPQSTTVEVWIQTPNPGERLRPGGTVRATINAGTVPDAVVVPVEALLPSDEGGSAVYVVGTDSVAHQRKAQVGVRNAEKAQLLSGAKVGEQVVIQGGVGLTDGAKVKIEKPDEKGGEKGDEKPSPAAEKKAGEHE
jgi:HlyD family secretion protein